MITHRIPKNRRPTTPGEMLNEEYLKPLQITQTAFAATIGIPTGRLNEIIRGRRSVTIDTALRFSRALGTSPWFWLNLQQGLDLYDALHSEKSEEIDKIKPVNRNLQLA